ncbi:uncharacterized protein N7484_009884 [Penicillium longicatenatum]|uniref:uncharacterized protein n=1 Tax=Penicillium longicatenatum TaxID=1561947 RepID=UPI0025497863|nr:uncharacterized protein N7484_009884 [Penicillium longicatenatum]KAJ5636571.1 hypothetical protein N7484_009884 [Penicillium longicatenatum]
MSDVEAVSLPTTLDVGANTLAAVKANASGPPGKPTSPSRRASLGSNPGVLEDDEQGPPSPKADSEAETIIQSGRESLSPEKKRKHIRHDPLRQAVEGADSIQRKKPRINGDRRHPVSRSPSPSERAGSPPSVVKVEKFEDPLSVPRNVLDEACLNQTDKPRIYRKRSFSDSVDEKGERRRGSHVDLKHVNHLHLPHPPNTRSLSPSRPSHQRSASGSQIHSKKKAPTPLLTGYARQTSEDRQSTSSSASGSPLPSAHLRRLGSGVGASASPAKHMGPKKLRDKSGRTPLARACADRKHDQVVMRFNERPEDLNVPDNAGNTPLQIASLNGEASIVKFLLDSGCDINTKNIDKDTPLIDAVENGHVDVVKVLLEAGANPRTVNASGDEPYELVSTDLNDDEYDEIKKALADAKASARPGRRSEERVGSESKGPSSRRASAASQSRSPPPAGSAAASRRKTGRSEATRNDLLWTQPTPENLMNFAAKGDEMGVVSILNVLQKADNASLIAAAKGGHHDVLSLMYAMGNADADPNPLRGAGLKPGYNTPMLAAIGRGNTAVINLILSQPGFNPTRRLYEDRTYFELSRSRQGENWEDEYDILKSAYEKYPGGSKGRKIVSSPRQSRKDKDEKRSARRDSSSPVPRPKKSNDSPTRKPRHPKDIDSLKEIKEIKEKRREKERTGLLSARAKLNRDANEKALANSDHDSTHPDSAKPKSAAPVRRDSESSGAIRPDEIRKRRLIAGRRPQERDRRPSLFSSDSLSGREEAPKSRNEVAPDTNASLKRIRTEASPERSRSRGADSDRLSPESRKQKKRRVLADDKSPNVPNGHHRKSEDTADAEKPKHRRPQADGNVEVPARKSVESKKPEPALLKSAKVDSAHNNGDIKPEPSESVEKPVVDVSADAKRVEVEAEKRRQAEAKKAEDERMAEEKRVAEAERERAAKEEAERAAKAAQAAQAAREKAEEDERKHKEAEQRRAKQAEDERQKRLEQERARIMKMRRDQEIQEQRRRDALPGRLRISADLVGSNDRYSKSRDWLQKFTPLVTVFTRQLEPTCAADVADERWIPNYLVVPLLATNDLQLSQYASWEKRKATPTQRNNLWRCTRRHLVHTDDPKYRDASFGEIMQLDSETEPKYFGMEHVFWIRLSDFMDLVPHIPHLNGLRLDDFLTMHIDPEPSASSAQLNGHAPVAFAETNGTGIPNGHGYPRAGTYF